MASFSCRRASSAFNSSDSVETDSPPFSSVDAFGSTGEIFGWQAAELEDVAFVLFVFVVCNLEGLLTGEADELRADGSSRLAVKRRERDMA